MASSEDLHSFRVKIQEGNDLLKRCSQLENVEGIPKLKRKINAEVNFLLKLQSGSRIRREQLKCSNLVHLKGIVDVASIFPGVTSVLHPFHTEDDEHRILVDVVADDGLTWIKVVARNAHALHQISLGQGQFGEKSILQHAEKYLRCASSNPLFYKIPAVKFVFLKELPEILSKKLEKLGIIIEGLDSDFIKNDTLCEEFDKESDSHSLNNQIPPCVNKILVMNPDDEKKLKLNLDITTMIAYVSSLTNGNCFFRFKEKILNTQAQEERIKPVKPILDCLFEGKDLICCNTALEGFKNIIRTLGGKTEKERAKQLLDKVHVVPDHLSKRTSSLELTSQIKPRSKIIFGSGDNLQAITVTANTGFVRSAESQGVNLAVYIHQSRALTENKEKDAQIIQPSNNNHRTFDESSKCK